MKKKKNMEDYLKTIYVLSKEGEVHGSKIAEKMGITRPSVCTALKTLETDGYLVMDDSHAVYLTEAGRNIAENTHERHTLIQNLLLSLGVDKEIAAKDACEMEHGVSPESFEAFKMLAKKMKESIAAN